MHGNTKRCLPCAAEFKRGRDREAKRHLMADPEVREAKNAQWRERWHARGGNKKREGNSQERLCDKCERDISETYPNVKLCAECRATELREGYRELSAKQRQSAEFREKGKKRVERWLSKPGNHARKLEIDRERNRAPETLTARRKRYAEDEEYRAKIVAYKQTDEYKGKFNRSRRLRYATNTDGYRDKRQALRQARTPWRLKPRDVDERLKEQGGLCGICREVIQGKFHLDHIIPASLGGSNTFENLQVTHPFCNLSKGNRLP